MAEKEATKETVCSVCKSVVNVFKKCTTCAQTLCLRGSNDESGCFINTKCNKTGKHTA